MNSSSRLRLALVGSTVLVLLSGVSNALAQASASSTAPSDATVRVTDWAPLARSKPALAYEPNVGQTDPRVKFMARGSGLTVFLTANDVVLGYAEPDEVSDSPSTPGKHRNPRAKRDREVPAGSVRMRLKGAKQAVELTGLDELPGKTNYLIGNDPSRWQTNVPHFARVAYRDVYPGVDLVFHSREGAVEYDLEVAPGADAAKVELEFEGMKNAAVNSQGDLVLKTEKGEITHQRPRVYQEHGNSKKDVDGRYVLTGKGSVRFELGPHDKSRRLVIDPTVVYSTTFGGSDEEWVAGIAVDRIGNAYVTGTTLRASDFPTTPGSLELPPPVVWIRNAYVTKLDRNGNIAYSTLLGGSHYDYGHGIAVDDTGAAYVVGETFSRDFPMVNAFQPAFSSALDASSAIAFIAKLNQTGTAVLYSSFLAGTNDGTSGSPQVQDVARGVAVDATGRYAYVVGYALSRDFPTTAGAYQPARLANEPPNTFDAFVAKFDTTAAGLASLRYSTFLGGTDEDLGWIIAVDEAGMAYVAGESNSLDFRTAGISPEQYAQGPRHNPLDTDEDLIVLAKLNATGTELSFFTYLGGQASAYAIAVDRSANVYLGGSTASEGFPIVNGLPVPPTIPGYPPPGGGFATKLNTLSTGPGSIVYSTLLASRNGGYVSGIAVDLDGNALVTGSTGDEFLGTPPGTFPPGPYLVKLDPQAALLASGPSAGGYYAFDLFGNAYVATTAFSPATNTDVRVIKGDGIFVDVPPDCRGCNDVGLPVNLFTGSVWLNQTDVMLPGVNGINFTRSYNSVGVREITRSAFGPGWTHPFERNLMFAPAGLRLRQGDGLPMTFTSADGGTTYRASVPASETSWIIAGEAGFARHFRDGSSEIYDLVGHLTKIIDPVGNEMTFGWEGALLTTIRDPGGRELTLGYTGSRITTLSGPAGVIARYQYDLTLHLQKVIYADQRSFSFTYDGSGRLLKVTDRTGRAIETHEYYSDGRAKTSEVADRVERVTLTYNPGVTQVKDALNNEAFYIWESSGGTNKVTKRTGSCITCGGADGEEWSYFADGRLKTHKVGLDPAIQYTYFPTGEVETVTDPLSRVTSYTYDDAGRILTLTAPGRGTTVWTQSPAGPLTVTVPVSATQSRTTTFTYYPNGKLETVKDSNNKVTTNFYDDLGDLRWVRDPLQHETRFDYDNMGRIKVVTDPLNHRTTTTYDLVGRVEKVTLHDNTHTDFTYNARGQRETVRDPRGFVTTYSYDRYGRLELVVDANKGETRHGYNLMSQMTSLKDAKGQVTGFEYDGQGRLKKTTYPTGRTEELTYDVAGRLFTRRDRKQLTTTFHYDEAGRLEEKEYSDTTPSVTFGYDDADRVTLASNGVDTVNRTYDLSGALLTESSTGNASTLRYEYDAVGRRQHLKLGSETTPVVSYEYDDASRLHKIFRGSAEFVFDYDNAGRRRTLTYPSPNGVVTSYAYDDVNRLLGITAVRGGVTVDQVAYTYDAAGNRLSKTTPTLTEAYKYDRLSRLLSVDRGNGALSGFGYDPVGNREVAQAGSRVVKAAFNERNELRSEAAGGPLRVRGALSEAGNVTVAGAPAASLAGGMFEALVEVQPGANELLVEARDGSGNTRRSTFRVTVPPSSGTFDYDLNGNLILKNDGTNLWTYEWTADNELNSVKKDGIEVARFLYDPFGRRIQKVSGGSTTRYVYDGDDIFEERVTGGESAGTWRYLHGPGIDEPLSRELLTTATVEYYHADGLGSLTRVTDQTGAVVLARQYDAWGNLELGAAESGYAFTGREWDPEIGLYYYRARYYDPKVGRFIGEDPLGFGAGDSNFYAYVSGNPVNRIDPSGKIAPAVIAVVAGIWAAIEIGLSIYDAYDTGKTLLDPEAPLGDKVASGGGFAAGAIMPGGGYGTGAKKLRTVVESKEAMNVADALIGKCKVGYEKIKDLLARGLPGKNQHNLTGSLKGSKAADLPGSGRGRGAQRVIFDETDDEVFIKSIEDYHK